MPRSNRVGLLLVVIVVAACGGAPLGGFGQRSSEWINKPTLPSTTTVVVTVPLVASGSAMVWFNDDLVPVSTEDQESVRAAVFSRRAGDLFIQASRAEIAMLIPELKFPSQSPQQGRFVTSQAVFQSDGNLGTDPSAAFGIWSSEPYTRSRSVAQMIVMRVATDPETAVLLSEPQSGVSCALFSDNTTTSCEPIELNDRDGWLLHADNGMTLVWFDGDLRYELFGRSFVPVGALTAMAASMVPLSEIESAPE